MAILFSSEPEAMDTASIMKRKLEERNWNGEINTLPQKLGAYNLTQTKETAAYIYIVYQHKNDDEKIAVIEINNSGLYKIRNYSKESLKKLMAVQNPISEHYEQLHENCSGYYD